MKAILVGVLFNLALLSSTHAGALLKVQPSSFELGAVVQNSTVFHDFWVKSIGDEPVVFDSVTTGCACALVPLERDTLAPGDSMRVTMRWKIYRQMNLLGQGASIYYNSLPRPAKMGLQAFARTDPVAHMPLAVTPYRFNFGKVPRQNVGIDSIDFEIANKSANRVAIKTVRDKHKRFDVVFPEIIEGKSVVAGFARLKPEYADTEFQTSVTFEISDKKKNRFTVPVQNRIYKQ